MEETPPPAACDSAGRLIVGPAVTRIFSTLALLAFLLLALNLMLGLSTGDYNGAAQEFREAGRNFERLSASDASAEDVAAAKQEYNRVYDERVRPLRDRAWLHMWIGIGASLVTILVNSITVTYFIGTTRWCREVAETYRLDTNYIRRSTALKRQTFPWALGGILTILVVVASGAASDPSARVEDSSEWVAIHYTSALVGVGFIGLSFVVQARNLAANYRIINEIIAEVQQIRQKHGLAVE